MGYLAMVCITSQLLGQLLHPHGTGTVYNHLSPRCVLPRLLLLNKCHGTLVFPVNMLDLISNIRLGCVRTVEHLNHIRGQFQLLE
jgi:hypothetical protein